VPLASRVPLHHAEMEFVEIGTGLRVSRIALGTWAMGGWMWGGTDISASIATVRAALDRGINLIDTAPAYGFGFAEEIIGRALSGATARSRVVIATKAGLEWRGTEVYRNASRERILHEVEDSLRRLRTDYIDIYLVHWPDPLVPIWETAEAMRSLYESGKIRCIGVSNFSLAQLQEFRQVAPLHVVQPPYNLFERGIEADILPYCHRHGIVTLGYGALCRGLLTGRMWPDSTFPEGDLRWIDPKFQKPRFLHYLEAVRQLDQLARTKFDRQVLHLAVRWVLDRGCSVGLWGARRLEQLFPVSDALGWSIDAATMAQIDRILSTTIEDPIGPEFMAPMTRPLQPGDA
jgi:aryl-alcohol dehydrogenase-like predicted oxidoreductase